MRKARRAAARRGRRLRIMFTDEARFGRINRPRPCWAPIGTRPEVASQLIREYIYLYGAACPKDGTCVYLIMPTSNTACFQIFLNVLSRKFARQDILLVLDGAPNHRCKELALPNNISLLFLPPYSPELNPKENLWDEIREKLFKNYALKSIDAVRAKLKQAILYIESKTRPINHVIPIYRQVILMWKWYQMEPWRGQSGATNAPDAIFLLCWRNIARAAVDFGCLFSEITGCAQR